MGQRPRSDADNINWQDDGCPDLGIPLCKECPLPMCRFEMPPGRARAILAMWELDVLLREGVPIEEAARLLGVSRRTAYRLRRLLLTGTP